MFRRPNGWQRIGLILSVVWVVAVIMMAASQYSQMKDFDAWLEGFCPIPTEPEFVHWYDAKSGARISIFRSDERTINCREASRRASTLIAKQAHGTIVATKGITYSNLFAAIFLPIIAFWLLVYLVVFLFKWVRDGFRYNV